MERARKENLPIYLSATPAGLPLYKSLCFRTIGKWRWHAKQGSEWDIMQWDHFSRTNVVWDEPQDGPSNPTRNLQAISTVCRFTTTKMRLLPFLSFFFKKRKNLLCDVELLFPFSL